MPSNITIPTTGSGDATPVVATEQISTAHYQKIKIVDGTAASTTVLKISTGGAMLVDGTATVQPISASALPLPSGASTSAKQPAIGTAGVSSVDVISIQGISSGTAVPISGTVTANAGTGSLTVNAPVGTPAFVRLSDGSAAITTLPVSLASVPSHAVTNAGTFAVQVSSQVAPSNFKDLGANTTLNVKSSAGVVFSLYCHNSNAADRYIQLHNTATVPVNTNVPAFSFRVPAGADIVIGTDFFTAFGASFATGIAFAFSTTGNTLTLGANTDQMTMVEFN